MLATQILADVVKVADVVQSLYLTSKLLWIPYVPKVIAVVALLVSAKVVVAVGKLKKRKKEKSPK